MSSRNTRAVVSGSFRLTAEITFAGNDVSVTITGPDERGSHIGCVCIGISRPSLTGDGSRSATVSTFNVTGHRDDEIGARFAKEIASSFGCVCAVSCGVHLDGATGNDITLMLSLSGELLAEVMNAVLLYKRNEHRYSFDG